MGVTSSLSTGTEIAMDGSRQRFLDQALEGYRAGARAWSRDALLGGLVLLFAGVFVVAPFVGWTGERRAVEDERLRVQQTEDRVVAAARGIDGLLTAVAQAQAAAATTADQLAASLSDRLRRFASLVRGLQPGAPPEPGAPPPAGEPPADFPGAAIAQQSAPPPAPLPGLPAPPGPAQAAAVLQDEFALSSDDLEQFRRAFDDGSGSDAWAHASATSERLFKAEIERTYGQLETAVDDQLTKLRATLAKGLDEIAAKAPEVGSGLPKAEDLLPAAAVVRLPSEDTLFRSVEGKAVAFNQVGLYQVELDLDAAAAPLHAVADRLADADTRLQDQRARLAANKAEIDRQLHDLDGRLETIQGELGGLGAPLKWLAIDTASFVQLYPTLLALAALWLAVRYRRLDDLRGRVEAGYRELEVPERDIRLALYVPEAALGWLQEPAAGLASALRLLRPALALGLALGLVLVTVWLQRAGEEPSLGWAALPLALGLAACALILAERRQPAGRLT
jgi:hypothetical protein